MQEGNVFIGVYLFTESMLSLPVWLPGPMFLLSGLPPGGGSTSMKVGGLPPEWL